MSSCDVIMRYQNLTGRKCAAGFTYIGILLSIALMGTTLAAVGQSWAMQNRRADEQQLLFAGQAFRQAIASYYRETPLGAHQYPTSLQDLISDDRGTQRRRHLREIYPDPMTGAADWEVITLADGALIGVASRSNERPMKQSNFGVWEAKFENAACYCDWRFVFLPQLVGDTGVTD
jgi:type II secretory pathway pseudopilin PulG